MEARGFAEDYEAFQLEGVTILGVSPDNSRSHAKFKKKYNIPYTLLADPDKKVCNLFGVWGPKKFMGREYEGVLRTTFLIDANGMITQVFENVKPEGHSKEILASINTLANYWLGTG